MISGSQLMVAGDSVSTASGHLLVRYRRRRDGVVAGYARAAGEQRALWYPCGDGIRPRWPGRPLRGARGSAPVTGGE